jgi:hypothetical protein
MLGGHCTLSEALRSEEREAHDALAPPPTRRCLWVISW